MLLLLLLLRASGGSFSVAPQQICFYFLLLFSGLPSYSAASLKAEDESTTRNESTETTKSEITKREEPEAQRREHSFNPDGTVNYHGSGSGHDSGDLIPPPGGSVFNSPSIEISAGHTGVSGPGLSNSYGLPIPDDSYGPPKPINFYGPPTQQQGSLKSNYLPPPKPVYGPPKISFRPQAPPRPVYGLPDGPQLRPPKISFSPGKSHRSKPSFNARPKPVYGPPKEIHGTGFPHGTLLSPVSNIKTQYGPPKLSTTYGTPLQLSTSYGVPKHPKHGQISAPPTPPVVKYDGWKPIPGLVSSGPSSSYDALGFSGHGISTGHGFDLTSTSQLSGGGFGDVVPPSSSYGVPSVQSTSFGSSGFGINLQSSSSFSLSSKPSLSYGTPLQPSTSYGPPSGHKGSSKLNFLTAIKPPSSSYGLPEPSFAPLPPKPSHSYGPPKAPSSSYGLPQLSSSYGLPKPPSSSYGPPKSASIFFGSSKPPSGSYGPPKVLSSSYGPPSGFGSFGPPSGISGSLHPPKIPSSSYGPPKPPSTSYGVPKAPSSSYGPPKSISNSFGSVKPPSSSYGPPKPPSNSYGPPKSLKAHGVSQIFTTYSIPKPSASFSFTPNTAYRGPSISSHPLQPPSTFSSSSFQEGLYKTPLPPNALYGVPTASGSPSGFGSTFGGSSWQFHGSSFGGSTTNFNSPVVQSVPSIELNSQFLSSGPSPIFSSAIPSTSYGTPLTAPTPASVHPPSNSYGVPTALPLRQPKNPVKFRPPVPAGLISSIGAKWGDSAAWGGNVHSHKFHGNTYIPPAVPDPDPGIQANKGNALVIPPPPAPPISYGPPQGNHDVHGQVSNQFVSTVPTHPSGEGTLSPPPPPPPPLAHTSAHGSLDIQQSASIELPSSNNVDNVHGKSNQFSSSGTSSYSAPPEPIYNLPESTESSVNHNFNNAVQNIPIKGTQGSYTLQIQAAGGNSGEHIPHNEVLSNGLLQDILAAIENPGASGKLEQYGGQQSSDPVASEIGLNILKQLGGTHAQQSNSIQLPSQYGSDLSHSSSSNVPLYAKNSDANNEIASIPSTNNVTESEVKIGNYLSENKIALYYNNQDGMEDRKGDGKDILLVQMLLPGNSTNSESERSDFGTLVSIKLQNAQNEGEVNLQSRQGDDGS